MIDSQNLRTASLYINNQLLSRGLLRDGHGIDFAHPGDTDGEVAETMSRIIAVVNDLILRRDRDAEHRESLSATLRSLRAESLRQANDIQRLQDKHAEAQRKANLSEAAESALRTHLKSAEATIHRLKEEAARTKTLVSQTRAACANEVRKRDRQIEGLRKAATEAGRARGTGKSSGLTTISVVGDVGSDAAAEQSVPGGGATADQGYDLRTETNAFLAELAKGLSEENEALLQLIRRTIQQLKEMSGWDFAGGHPVAHGDGHAMALATNPADIALEVDAVLEHLRTILTNPSFVPIEEVVVREDEIHRLRDGWEKMETRWKEAVHLIDGWRRRMQASGRPVNVEELKMGLRLSPVRVKNVEETAHGFALRLDAVVGNEEAAAALQEHHDDGPLELAPEPAVEHDESDTSSAFDHDVDVDVDALDVEEPNVEILQQSVMIPAPPLPPPPQLTPLRDSATAGNRGGRPDRERSTRGCGPTAEEEKKKHVAAEEPPLLPHSHAEKPHQPPQKRPLLSLRPVPPEEAAGVALPPSAVVSTPDTSVGSIPNSKPADGPTSKPAAAGTRNNKRAAPPANKREATKKDAAMRKKEPEQTKPSARPPAKPRPTRPPITRGRSETRKDEKARQQSKPPPRAGSATSVASTRSAGAKSASSDTHMAPPAGAESSSSTQSPNRSPRRVNSRLPLPRPGCNGGVLPAPQQSPLNMAAIAAKLAASEREADAARVRAKLKAARLGGKAGGAGGGGGGGANAAAEGAASTAGSTAAATEVAANVGGGMSNPSGGDSNSSSSAAMNGSASASASASDNAPPSSATTREDHDDDDDDDDADELGFSPPSQQQPKQQKQKQQQQQQQQQRGSVAVPVLPAATSVTGQASASAAASAAKGTAEQKRPAAPPPATRKRERRASKAASRRRSTLNPWELDALIQGGKVPVER